MFITDESEGVRSDLGRKTAIHHNDSTGYGLGWRQETKVHLFRTSHRNVTHVVHELPGFFVRLEN